MNHTPTVLVTGAEGLLGRHIVRALVDSDVCQVKAVSRRSIRSSTKNLTWVSADLRQISEVQAMVDMGVDVIIHAAVVLPSTLDDVSAAQTNRMIDDNVISLSHKVGASLIYISSQSVYENCDTPWTESLEVLPVSAYAASKYRSEMDVRVLGLPAVTLRISSPYSAFDIHRQGVLFHFAREAVAGRPIIVTGKGTRAQDFVHGADIALAVIAVIKNWQTRPAEAHTEIFNIANGRSLSMTELAQLVVRCCGSGEVVHNGVEAEPAYKAELSILRARDILNWQPCVDLRAGVEQLIRHMRGFHEDWLVV